MLGLAVAVAGLVSPAPAGGTRSELFRSLRQEGSPPEPVVSTTAGPATLSSSPSPTGLARPCGQPRYAQHALTSGTARLAFSCCPDAATVSFYIGVMPKATRAATAASPVTYTAERKPVLPSCDPGPGG